MGTIYTLPDADVTYLDQLLFEDNNRVRLLPASVYHKLNYDHLRIWATRNARYLFPTTELIEWLGTFPLSNTIEIGAGMGDLGCRLGIHMTDSAVQQEPLLLQQFKLMQQTPTDPPPDVERIDAALAVSKYKPHTVLASWVTQYKPFSQSNGFFKGVDEVALLDSGIRTYIHIGNEAVHGGKTILKRAFKAYRFPWLVSRAIDPTKNVIYVWS